MGRHGLVAVFVTCFVLGCDGGGTFGPNVTQGPDLRLVSIDIPTLRQGQTAPVTVVVRSNGTDPVPAPFTVELIVALDTNYSTHFCGPFEWQREVLEGDLEPGAELELTADVAVALADPVGMSLYFLATADSGDEVEEGLETNNTMTGAATITPPPKPDLAVASCLPQGMLRAGQSGTVVITIVNAGELPAGAPFPVSLEFYTDNTRTVLFDSADWTQQADLAPGETASFELALSIPSTYSQPRLYYTAFVDVPSAVDESDETNNVVEGAVQVLPPPKPDLTVSVDYPASGMPNSSISYSITVRNRGDLASPATTVRYTFYRVQDGVEYEGMTYWQSFGALAPGGSETANKAVLTSGLEWWDTLRIRLWVDPDDTIEESNENNNTDEADCYIG